MGWLVLAPSALAAVLWLFAPGLLAVLAARQRGFAALALAPAASAGIIAVAAIGASWLGVPWGPWPVAVLAVLTALAVAGLNGGLRLAAGRHRGPTAPKPLSRPRLSGWPKAARAAWIRSERPYFWLGAAGAAALLTRHLRNILDRPDAFSQTYDNIFHMNAVRWILDTQDGSSLTLTAMTSGNQPPEFYPAAWHDFVSLVALTTGDPLLAHACNAVIWAVMALAWPLGGLFLVQTLLRRLTPAGVLGAAVLTASFGAFPTLLVGFGVLYPNFLGFALLPAVLALTCQSLGLSAGRRPPTPLGLVLLAVALTGLALAHPNAALSYAAILVPLGLRWAWQGWRLRSAGRWRRPAGLVLGLAAAAVLWVKIR
ncbi:MAG: hypothetical protein LBI84_03450, partial [Propionibacteriaceae bacterium]|nr:hypothetical protein [Propionibacteriaceae bacterium]